MSDLILKAVAALLIAVHDLASVEGAAIEGALLAIARNTDLAQRLMAVPSVGPIVALNSIAPLTMEAGLPGQPMPVLIWASRRDDTNPARSIVRTASPSAGTSTYARMWTSLRCK